MARFWAPESVINNGSWAGFFIAKFFRPDRKLLLVVGISRHTGTKQIYSTLLPTFSLSVHCVVRFLFTDFKKD